MHVHDILIAIMHNRLAPQCSTFVVERFFLLLAAAVALVASFTKIYYVGRQYQELIRGKERLNCIYRSKVHHMALIDDVFCVHTDCVT